ncbi:UNVERIFIED_CONTAM: hypothetical protein GTU68_003113 [Idotea baltica]|nr:hypothetical protein [Idotea baltica]
MLLHVELMLITSLTLLITSCLTKRRTMCTESAEQVEPVKVVWR